MLKRILLIILLLISYSVMNLSKGLDAKLFSTPEKKNVLPKPEEYYGYERAIEDSGIFSANKKNGEGINIGVLDGGIPDSFEPFVSGKYYCYGNKKSDHAREVGAILGGKKGIANGATLYFTSYEDFENYDNCLKWLIVEKKCNIINISRNIGPGSGAYDDFCELTDYYSKNYNVLFVCSNGNNDNIKFQAVPAASLNSVAVSASNSRHNKSVINIDERWFRDGDQKILFGPNIYAPGDGLLGTPYHSENSNSVIKGTSFSAPIVSGVAALLMDEFPKFKTDIPQLVSVLMASGNNLMKQSEIGEKDYGFGINGPATGNYNKGRICLDDIVFSTEYASRGFISSFYEPIGAY